MSMLPLLTSRTAISFKVVIFPAEILTPPPSFTAGVDEAISPRE